MGFKQIMTNYMYKLKTHSILAAIANLCSLSTGQFWNIPINVAKYNGPTRGDVSNANLYTVTVKHPRSQNARTFVGRLHDLTWEFTPTSCLYVGNRQAGTIGEVVSPNDPVIEGSYTSYRVDNAFDNTYEFAVFNSTCT